MTDNTGSSSLILRSAWTLGVLALVGTALLTWVHWFTAPRIAEQERRQLLSQLEQVLPAQAFDNDMHEDYIDVQDGTAFPGRQTVRIFRARRDSSPAAAVMKLAAPDGYNGRINLLVGVYANGNISGVRVLGHNETPGLGDGIELQRSDWILSFDEKSLNEPGPAGWAVKRDGGNFDQFTGATITPRAVVRAVHRALLWFEAHKKEVFEQPSLFQAKNTQNEAANE